ncbi:hypothetical protein ARMGADRAFT_1040636 [Armillaria gallica]|uniref:Uncharacterized protein n=1 Tax=Armillaria gallica TaxID=47427 RepID=A0A2H3CMM6_ARMGA|nr:hypothetical protein ARMGADRAFT_1040636 [Armillaria gallica]
MYLDLSVPCQFYVETTVSYFGDRDEWDDCRRKQRRVRALHQAYGTGGEAAGTISVGVTRTKMVSTAASFLKAAPTLHLGLRPVSFSGDPYGTKKPACRKWRLGSAIHRRPRSEPLPRAIHYPYTNSLQLHPNLASLAATHSLGWTFSFDFSFLFRHCPFSNDAYTVGLKMSDDGCIVFLRVLCGRWQETAASRTGRLEQFGSKDGLTTCGERRTMNFDYGIFPDNTMAKMERATSHLTRSTSEGSITDLGIVLTHLRSTIPPYILPAVRYTVRRDGESESCAED